MHLVLQTVVAATIVTTPSYIQPPQSNQINAPLPLLETSEQVVGIYGNIFYPRDNELLQQKKLSDWFDAYSIISQPPLPLDASELNDISLYILERLPKASLTRYFSHRYHFHIKTGHYPGYALELAKQETRQRAVIYKKIALDIPRWNGRCEMLSARLVQCANQVERIIAQEPSMQAVPALIDPPFTWRMRREIFKQMVDKIIAVSPNSPYFLALQEVTPQALHDLKTTLADKNLQWISFNNISGSETLLPRVEHVFGESTAFTSTIALSHDLEVLKIGLGDIPNESGSIRKILGVRVRNKHNDRIYNLFSTHTDHRIQNGIYARTAAKIHSFATEFFKDEPTQQFVIGGDFNAFETCGGGEYMDTFYQLFSNCRDFRESDFYVPNPIAWSSFIGHADDQFAAQIDDAGFLDPNALDHIITGSNIEINSSAREAAVYDSSGRLLDYFNNAEAYKCNLKNRITFSDHFFSIIRFR